MTDTTHEDVDEEIAALYRFVSSVLADPPDGRAVERLLGTGFDPDPDALPGALGEGLSGLQEWTDGVSDPDAEAERLRREHTRLFVGPRPALQIHESYYADDYLGEPLARVKGSYAGLDIAPGEDLREEADHAAVELAAIALLKERGDRAETERFLRDHGWWLPDLAADLREKADGPFYESVADLIEGLVELDTERLDVDLDVDRDHEQ